jgi:hypothetical protein
MRRMKWVSSNSSGVKMAREGETLQGPHLIPQNFDQVGDDYLTMEQDRRSDIAVGEESRLSFPLNTKKERKK